MRRRLLVGWLAMFPGCYAGLPGQSDADANADSDAAGESDGESGDDEGDSAGSAEVRFPLRRLSHVEYDNTLRDLFPGLELPTSTLPPDPKPRAFDNDAEALVPSSLLIDGYARAAQSVAAHAVADLGWMPCDAADEGCSRTFVETFGARVFRRPLDAEEVDRFHLFFEREPGNTDFVAGVQLTLELMLQAPQFLYRLELSSEDDASLDGYELASRLSYFLWGSMPDAELFAAADDRSLLDPEVLETHARRMLDDGRAKRAFWHFHRQWFHLDRLDRVTKADQFTTFTEATRAAMAEETERFVTDILFDGGGTIEDLFTSNRSMVDGSLAEIYDLPAVQDWTEVELDPSQRAGFLTQPSFLAAHGHATNPSPVLRGVYVIKEVMCMQLGSPPAVAEAMKPPELGEGMTNRKVYEELTSPPECAGCHTLINGIGFSFENYDTIGAWRTQDNGLPVDATGSFGEMQFDDAVELARQLAQNEQVQRCVAEQWLRFAYGGEAIFADEEIVDDVLASTTERSHRLDDLLVAVVTHPRFKTR